LAAQHGHPDAEDLAGAKVAVRRFCHVEEFIERFHPSLCYASASVRRLVTVC
jgi:hypothetical protein